MSIFTQLSENKGTVSSALGKELAEQVLREGRTEILLECIDLTCYEVSSYAARNTRAGAAKVVEVVAKARPELVAPHLERMFPALAVPEPQTRWMVIRVMGFCAKLNTPVAERAVPYAAQYIAAKEGLVIASSADLFLGDLGAVSAEQAQRVFPLLRRSMASAILNEQDWLLEALLKVYGNLGPAEQEEARSYAGTWQDSSRKSTQQRARRILHLAH